ncbi:MAG: DNA polymerase III subunit delta [Xanthomonadales bacterium]|nr:DNA polymerase III subunit delta [Xanthomonadales bacterium]
MPLRAEQLAANLQRGLAPVYLVGGEEPLLLQECCDQIREAAKAQGFVEREILTVERGFDWSELQQAAAPSLFASQKIIDLRLRTGKPGREGSKVLGEWAEAPDPNMILLVSCEQWDASSRKSKWAAKLEKAGQRVDIWPIKAQELPRWLEQRMLQHGMQPEPEVLRILADRLEGNLLAARQEIDRLALLKGAGTISVDDVMKVVADSSRFDAFGLAENMLAGNLRESLRVAAGLRRMDTPIPLLLGALLKELKTTEAFRFAMRGGEQESMVFRRLNVWHNKQNIVRSAARRLNTRQLFKAFRQLSLIDRQSKGQAAGDPWQSLDSLLLQLAR